jgi:uncharacterized alpha-E superfamily protein
LPSLLARHAEALFWMARYIERAENLARIIDVQQSDPRANEPQFWGAIVAINSDQERFFARDNEFSAAAVLHFYVLDGDNPSSILAALRAARDNGRALRPLISTEMWMQLNALYNRVRELGPADIALSRLPKVCAMVKEGCQSHTGITEGTFYRDQGWYFYQLGRYVERADQTTRLLDVKWHALREGPAGPVQTGAWGGVLRSVAGYHAFRRVRPRDIKPAEVVGFLLLNDSFPRSVALCVDECDRLLRGLRAHAKLRGGERAIEHLEALRAAIGDIDPDEMLHLGLHEVLDFVQRRLDRVTAELARDFFGYTAAPVPADQHRSAQA